MVNKGLCVSAFMVAAASMLLACASVGGESEPPKPLTSGVLMENRDTAVRPQDDFFHFVNGGWLAANDIPDDKSRDGSFERLREAADDDVRKIIEESAQETVSPDSPEGRISLLYNSFMDEDRVNALGIKPLQAELAQIDAIADKKDLLSFFAYADDAGIKYPLGLSVMPDFDEPDRYRIFLFQSGLGLPNSDFYTDESEKGQAIIAAYKDYALKLYLKLGYSDQEAGDAVNGSWALESALASHHRPPEKNRNYPLWHNLYGPGQDALPDTVAWDDYFSGFGLSTDKVISVAQPEFLAGFALVLGSTSLPEWKNYLKLRLISSSASYLSQDLQELSFDFYSRTLQGTPEMRPRWKRGVSFVNGAVGESVGQIYVQQHFPAIAKTRMDELVANLVLAYRESIESLDWMGEETRANALEKLEKFTPNIGYPAKWKDYSSMALGDDLLANARGVSHWDLHFQLDKLGKPVDKREWSMNPQTVNAYYSALQNSINFPAAILQAPFFDPAVDDAVNYGAIGSVIGHEIGHGFDDSGAQFDGDGRLNNWWTDDDRAAFKSRTEELIKQYDAFEILPGVAVNGAYTQGENIGDLAGASIAYKAYLKSLDGKPAPVMDGYTGQQRFFIGFAQAFLGHSREERARQMIKTDVHSPEIFRVNGTLSNVDGFYEAFNIESGDAMYRAPEKRVAIW
ncbi:MAG: M13 family metallopeptidase [Halioglobus sp.]